MSIGAGLLLFIIGAGVAVWAYESVTGRKVDGTRTPPQPNPASPPCQTPRQEKTAENLSPPTPSGKSEEQQHPGLVLLMILGGVGLVWFASELGVGKKQEPRTTRPYVY